jgi:putative ATPase
MDLFSATPRTGEPLAYRMRPTTLDEFVGQEHIVGAGRLLRRIIQADQISSLIFSGPPGTGKTTLAQVIAHSTKSHFITMNAVLDGVKDLREALEVARKNQDLYGRRTTLFVDEVHRWNKAQQDALLPSVESGTIILIGATTENPYFEVNRALVSRSRIFQLKSLTEDDLRAVARAAIADPVRGYGKYRVEIDADALDHLVQVANGDARSLLNAIELAVETTPARFPPAPEELIHITRAIAEESIQRKVVLYDKEGDYHFDTVSAFIKSVRGSDPDAAFYWLAKMVAAGEDPHFAFRRMLILASEDVGMADPNALPFVQAAAAAFDRVGMPEGRFHLAHAALYLATAPKSNSVLGFFDALGLLESEQRDGEVPNHLRDASRDKDGFGHGEGYLYPHAFQDHWVAQQYLPAGLQGKVFYEPSPVGYEATLREQVLRRREVQIATALEPPSVEILTFSSPALPGSRWIERLAAGRQASFTAIRDRLFDGLPIRRHSRVLDVDARSGLLLWEALRRAPEGGVWGCVRTEEEQAILGHRMKDLGPVLRPTILRLASPLAAIAAAGPGAARAGLGIEESLSFEIILGRSLFTRATAAERAALARLLLELSAPEGSLAFAEVVPGLAQRLSALLPVQGNGLREKIAAAEAGLYAGRAHPLLAWGPEDLATAFREAGAAEARVETETFTEERRISARDIDAWLAPGSPYGAAVLGAVSRDAYDELGAALRERVAGRPVPWTSTVAFLRVRR